MSREDVPWIAVVVVLLVVGFAIGQRSMVSSEDEQTAPAKPVEHPFRPRFWEERVLDLLVQGGLIFAGAVSIAALLPRGREEDVQ